MKRRKFSEVAGIFSKAEVPAIIAQNDKNGRVWTSVFACEDTGMPIMLNDIDNPFSPITGRGMKRVDVANEKTEHTFSASDLEDLVVIARDEANEIVFRADVDLARELDGKVIYNPINGEKMTIAAELPDDEELDLEVAGDEDEDEEEEIEASDEIRELWQEAIDIDTEIDSMLERKDEIKKTFSLFACKSLAKKTILPGNEPRKLNVMAGQRKLFTVSRPEPGAKVSRSSTERISEENPALYEEMKATTFADILGDVDLTDKQAAAVAEIDAGITEFIAGKNIEIEKFLSKKKLSAILSRESIIKAIERAKPELYKKLVECSIIEMTEPAARLTIKKPEGE